jgi:hypothetical protein
MMHYCYLAGMQVQILFQHFTCAPIRDTHLLRQFMNINTVAYLPQARKVEPQNQPFLSNTRTNNGTVGLCNLFLGYGPVNTLPCRCMRSHSNSTGWESRDLSTARYSWLNSRTKFSVRFLYNATLVIFQIVQFLTRRVPDEAVQFQRRRREWSDSFSYEWIMVAAEARGQDSELTLGAQKKTRGQPVKNWRVIRRCDLCVMFEDRVIVPLLRSIARKRTRRQVGTDGEDWFGSACRVKISNSVISNCSHYLQAINKSNYQSEPHLSQQYTWQY